MFWGKAHPKGPDDVEAFRRAFDMIEMPDAGVFEASVAYILSALMGFRRSIEQRSAVSGGGESMPMMSYSFVEYILGLDLSTMELLELGGGASTPFWAARAAKVMTFEPNAELVKQLAVHPNVTARLCSATALPGEIRGLDAMFDIIVVDAAANRHSCAKAALPKLKPGGFVVLDNSDWYPNAAKLLRDGGLIQVDFHDFRPLHHFRCTTSIFLHPAFRPKPKGARLPQIPVGGKDMAPTNTWDRIGM